MRIRRLSFLAVSALLLALPAYPQGVPTGSISGEVEDPQGAPLPGVSVTVSSPALQGTRTATTSTNGDYIIPFLPAGEYTVSFDLTGFASLKYSRRLALGQALPLSAKMNISTVTETVTVTSQAPGDFSQTPQVATSFKADLIDKLPNARNLQAAALLTPGVQASGPNGALAVSGAFSYENLFMLNGVVIQDNIRSTPFNLFVEDALQETTTSVAGISAEYGRFSGGVLNAVTKSGGNDFSGSYRATFDNNKWMAVTPYPNDKRTDKLVLTHEATLGGPFIKDKLWFFGSGRFHSEEAAATTSVTNISYTQPDDQKRYEGKLTYSPVRDHTVSADYTHISESQQGNSFGTILDLASLVSRQLPQDLLSANYTGIINPKFFVEARYALRKFTFENSGSLFTDITNGTLLLDQSRGNARYHSPTFCGVCGPEKRDNNSIGAKATYFASTGSLGSHNIGFGFDVFDDKRFSNNHQSGSDFRIFGTSAIVQGTNIYPVFDQNTFIRWTPIFQSSQGNDFRTISGFVNDSWRFNNHLSFNVGLRYDKNDGANSLGQKVVKDSAFSPRLSVTFDPKGNGEWTINASYGKYVAAIANSIGDSSSSGGVPATIDFDYLGPAINVGNPANPISQNDAINAVFAWFNANGGTNRATRGNPSIPGLTSQIANTLASPNVVEFTFGLARKLGSHGLARVDGIYRKYHDFYADQIDLTTGRVSNNIGQSFDLDITQNNDSLLQKDYKGINVQVSYRVDPHLSLEGNYTLSQTNGNFDGETGGSGPVTAAAASGPLFYPQYRDATWNYPAGDLLIDVRHRARFWAVWDLPLPQSAGKLSVSGLEIFASGTPYGSFGTIDPRPFVTNPGYLTPPAAVNYYFQPRDTFRMANTYRSDFALNYSHTIGIGKRTELFFRGIIENAFNRLALTDFTDAGYGSDPGCGTGGCINTTILTARNNAKMLRFNPFTATPVQGVNWAYGPIFGQPTNRWAYGLPRVYQFSVGLRF
jgi:hypothetical protein